jgi:hypothetical protein
VKKKKELSAWRAIYTSIDDDRDWRHLAPLSKCVFETLKRQLGQYGIEVVALETLPRIINCSQAQLDLALEELERDKPGKDHGWIRREDDVIWIVNGLRFEPSLTLTNNLHRTAAARFGRHLYALTGLTIVCEFMAYYGLGNPTDPNGKKAGDTHGVSHDHGMGDGMGVGSAGGSPEGSTDPRTYPGTITETETDTERETETDTESGKREKPAATRRSLAVIRSDSATATTSARYRSIDETTPTLIEFRRVFYPLETTDRKRSRDVERQLLALANGQAVRKAGKGKQLVRAGSFERLEAKCRQLMTKGVRSRESAMAYLLTMLADESDIFERQRIDEHNHLQLDTRRDVREFALRLREAETWLGHNLTLQLELDRRIDAHVAGDSSRLAAGNCEALGGKDQLQKACDVLRPIWRNIVLLEMHAEARFAVAGGQP